MSKDLNGVAETIHEELQAAGHEVSAEKCEQIAETLDDYGYFDAEEQLAYTLNQVRGLKSTLTIARSILTPTPENQGAKEAITVTIGQLDKIEKSANK